MSGKLNNLLQEVRACQICKNHLPLEPRPVLQVHSKSKILIAGQAPGKRVHDTGIAWNDPSGDRLRDWLGLGKGTFYNPEIIALVPMGFCYPGTGKSGDMPPRKECAQTWHDDIFSEMPNIQLTLAIGKYAQDYHLGKGQKKTLTETVRAWREYAPNIIPLPHPSPRNNIWLKKNPWFEEELLPELREFVGGCLQAKYLLNS